jgi:hypothetical protein
MRRFFSAVALAATAALLWQSVTPVQACSCIAPTGDRVPFYSSNAKIVLVGTVNEIVETEERGIRDFDLRVTVETYLKGSGPSEIVADDPIGQGDCGMFDPSYLGKRYVLFSGTIKKVPYGALLSSRRPPRLFNRSQPRLELRRRSQFRVLTWVMVLSETLPSPSLRSPYRWCSCWRRRSCFRRRGRGRRTEGPGFEVWQAPGHSNLRGPTSAFASDRRSPVCIWPGCCAPTVPSLPGTGLGLRHACRSPARIPGFRICRR